MNSQVAAGGQQRADFAVVEFGEAPGEPFVAVAGQQPGGQVCQLMHVLAGVEQVDDLGGLGEMAGGEVPDPRRAVAQDGELADVPGAAAVGLGGHQDPELRRGGEGGQVGGGTRVADRVAVIICGGLGERRRHLDLAGAGPAVVCLAGPVAVSAATIGTPVPSIAIYSLSGSGPSGGSRLSLPAATAAASASMTAAAARPSASARRPARLPVRVSPASSLTRRAAAANGTAAAARAVIFRSPGDMPCPATSSWSSRAPARDDTDRSDTRPGRW